MSQANSSGPFGRGSVVHAHYTRVVQLNAGQDRADADNRRTGVFVTAFRHDKRHFRDLFVDHYDALRTIVRRFAQPGVAIVAVDEHRNTIAGSACIATKPGVANAAIFGRHSSADLFVQRDDAISLRHLAIIVEPARSFGKDADVRYRVVDLHTATAFEDERGTALESIVAEGPAFLRCGSYAIFCLPTGDDAPWPHDATDAWDCIPQRVYLDERAAEPDRWKRARPAGPRPAGERDEPTRLRDASLAGRVTFIGTGAGPLPARAALLADGEQSLGTLTLSDGQQSVALDIGPRALTQGVLLGRYDRCDHTARGVLTDHAISRVHLMLLRMGERLFAIDTGSSNGTWRVSPDGDWTELRVAELEDGLVLTLGAERAWVKWTAA